MAIQIKHTYTKEEKKKERTGQAILEYYFALTTWENTLGILLSYAS